MRYCLMYWREQFAFAGYSLWSFNVWLNLIEDIISLRFPCDVCWERNKMLFKCTSLHWIFHNKHVMRRKYWDVMRNVYRVNFMALIWHLLRTLLIHDYHFHYDYQMDEWMDEWFRRDSLAIYFREIGWIIFPDWLFLNLLLINFW